VIKLTWKRYWNFTISSVYYNKNKKGEKMKKQDLEIIKEKIASTLDTLEYFEKYEDVIAPGDLKNSIRNLEKVLSICKKGEKYKRVK
jgi:hypothetical protein